ncbi:MAG: serine hydrolase domain-containing protein [Acidimicrobiales bacterium]
MSNTIDQLLQAGVDEKQVAGVVAMAVTAEGVRYEGAFGERHLGSGVAMTLDTVAKIASMTKPITGLGAMQLVEQGRLDLDAPASDVCPELGELVVLDGFDAEGQPILRPPTTTVTLRNLLTHTSGFGYEVWNPDLARYQQVTGTPSVNSGRKAALAMPLSFDPGTSWQYGLGIDWVGQMIEAVTGVRLGQYLAEHVTGQLGMSDTSFEKSPTMAARAATVHTRNDDGTIAAPAGPPTGRQSKSTSPRKRRKAPEFEYGGGGLHSTMADYARFIQMILNDGELDGARLLQPSTVAEMASNHIGELRVNKLRTADPALSNDAEFFPGEPKTWGLTFQINEEASPATGRAAGTLMWAGLHNSYFWIDRATGVGGCFLTQLLPFADEPTLDLYYGFERAVYTELVYH